MEPGGAFESLFGAVSTAPKPMNGEHVTIERPAPPDPFVEPATIEREVGHLAIQTGEPLTDLAYVRAREIIQEAAEYATELRLSAMARVRSEDVQCQQQAAEILSRANADADRIMEQSQVEVELALQRAQREADSLVTNARDEAEVIVRDANDRAATLIDHAQRQATEAHDQIAQALASVREREETIARQEREFEVAMSTFLKWAGLPTQAATGSFKQLLRRSR